MAAVLILLDALEGGVAKIRAVVTDEGTLWGFRVPQRRVARSEVCRAVPRLELDAERFEGWSFWTPGARRAGVVAALGEAPVYAGNTTWGFQGPVVPQLAPVCPAVTGWSSGDGVDLTAM
ncbi:MAG: hypothetical protein N2652_00530 [Kiritimatiellae bacterium]|nr:hypothetical protein [Kiritimatiellia bacterium]